MRLLLFISLLALGAALAQAEPIAPTDEPAVEPAVINTPEPPKAIQIAPPAPPAPPAAPAPKQEGKSALKGFFSSSLSSKQEEKDEKAKPAKISQRTVVDEDQLQKIIDSLPEQDQQVIRTIKTQISTWPKAVFDEISNYREFIIASRNIAKDKYMLLSPQAKSALATEKQLKERLSPETMQTLENLEVKTS